MKWTVLALAGALAACAATPPPAGLDASGPERLADFTGIWNGSWEGTLPTTLIVDRVTPPTAHALYEWGAAPAWQVDNPGFIRVTAHFAGDQLLVPLPSGVNAVFVLQPDGTLAAVTAAIAPGAHGIIHATLTRQ